MSSNGSVPLASDTVSSKGNRFRFHLAYLPWVICFQFRMKGHWREIFLWANITTRTTQKINPSHLIPVYLYPIEISSLITLSTILYRIFKIIQTIGLTKVRRRFFLNETRLNLKYIFFFFSFFLL
jgi:hypothetical protein